MIEHLTHPIFRNFNVFGLVFIITVACVVTILDLVLLKFLVFLRRSRRGLASRLDSWIQDGVFQLQRRAFEAHGEGTWVKLDQEIPSTMKGNKLHELPLESKLPPLVCKCSTKQPPEYTLSAATTAESQVTGPDEIAKEGGP